MNKCHVVKHPDDSLSIGISIKNHAVISYWDNPLLCTSLVKGVVIVHYDKRIDPTTIPWWEFMGWSHSMRHFIPVTVVDIDDCDLPPKHMDYHIPTDTLYLVV